MPKEVSEMLRKMLGIFTAVAAALVVVGVAWASSETPTDTSLPDDTASTVVTADSSTSTADDSTTSTSAASSSTSSTSATTPSTSIPGASTSTSSDDNGGSTSTTIDDTTSTTFDDSDLPVPDGTYQYQVASAGTVTIQVVNGAMSLGAVNVNSGWAYTVEKNRSDEVEVEFVNGEAEASIRVKADHGELDVEIEFESD